MRIIPYEDKYQSYAMECLSRRRMPLSLVYDLPKFGLIAFEGDKVVAMGFIRQMEGKYALMDSYISNPMASSELRHRALETITRKLVSIAKFNNIHKLIAFSLEKDILLRSMAHGFDFVPYCTTILDFTKQN